MEDLIYRSCKSRLSPAEEDALRSWRAASPGNEAHYLATVRIMELGEATLRAQVPPRPTVQAVTRRAAELGGQSSPPRRSGRAAFTVGGLALATAAGLSFMLLWRGVPEAGLEEYVTGANETEAVVLVDGTVIRLAPNSRLEFDATGQREVRLEGRAYFAVATDPNRSFRVITSAGVAEVLGTRFDLLVQGEDLRLVVVEGRVALARDGAPVEVGAGEMSSISGGAVSPPIDIDVGPVLAWVREFVVFQATPASEVAAELERVYGVRVEMADPALAGHTVTGTFSDRPFPEVFRTVCEVLQTACSFDGDTAKIGS